MRKIKYKIKINMENNINNERYLKIDKKVEKIVDKVSKYMVNLNEEYIRTEIFKAYELAKISHEGQNRLSGDPYLSHPVEAVLILLTLKPDLFTIQACFLHDVIEDTEKTNEDIKQEFWEEVAFLCEWVSKLSKVRYKWEDRDVWSLRKMFVAMAEDLRVIFIKLSDRLHNIQTLSHHPKPEKRKRIALETINIYSPVADRLWLYHFKNSLDEECFKILELEKYRKLKKELEDLRPQIEAFENNAKEQIEKLLDWNILDFEVDLRVKSIYSIHKKIWKKQLSNAGELYDLFWIRIIVKDITDCYRVLWIIHNKWTPLPSRFKDYIALPKPNWYKSLHTTIMWLFKSQRKQPTEIQIKTYEMKEYSDLWVAAHFEYKEKWSKIATDINWVKELKELIDSVWDSDFVWSLKVDVFKSRIFVFTPKWDFINLPNWSTPVDFAYALHTDLWDHISIAKVNNSIYPLDKELRNWDIIEIVVDKNKKPNPFWISFVKTVKAKNNIKAHLKKEDKDLHIERGKEMMNKYLEKAWFESFDKYFTILKSLDWVVYNKEDRLKILEQVWNFSVNPSVIIKKILKTNNIISKEVESKVKTKIDVKKEKLLNLSKKTIIIWWEEDLPYKIANCCLKSIEWKDLDNIVWHVNSKWIITIHKRDCTILDKVNKQRLLSAYFEWEKEEYLIINLELVFKNKIWVLKELSDIIFSMWIDVDRINTNHISNTKTKIDLKLRIFDYDYLLVDRFIERLKIKFTDLLISYDILHIEKSENN